MKPSSLPRPLMIFIFVAVFSLFLYVANLVVYDAFSSIFIITTSKQLLILGLSLFALSGSFIFSTVLGMRYYNAFTRTYYLLSAIWIGFFTYLFFASVLYGLLLIAQIQPARGIGEIVIILAVLASIYGVFHSRRIQISKIAITLPNLPVQWKGRNAILISDVHLGQIYGSVYAKKIVEKVNTLPHDIIFIAGDLYDGTGAADITELVAPFKDFSGKLGAYFVTGNHEEIGESAAFIAAVRSANINPLIDQKIEIEGLQLIGVDYKNSVNKESFKKVLAGLSIDPRMPSILLKHEPKDIDVARDAKISLQLSGHTHKAQMWPLGYTADLIYKGFAYGLKPTGEMQVYTSSGVGTWGPPMRVGTDCEIVHITFV